MGHLCGSKNDQFSAGTAGWLHEVPLFSLFMMPKTGTGHKKNMAREKNIANWWGKHLPLTISV